MSESDIQEQLLYYQSMRYMQKKSILDNLPPPNPIYEKGQLQIDETIRWKYAVQQQSTVTGSSQNVNQHDIREEEDDDSGQPISLLTHLDRCKSRIVFQRHNNSSWNMIPLNNQRYAASLFFEVKKLSQLNHKPIQSMGDLFSILKQASPMLQKTKQTERILNQNQSLIPHQEQENKQYRQLRFNSHFESGNLFAAIRSGEQMYDLIIQNDTNSKGNTQWFYYSIENTQKNQVIRFRIINFLKNDSLFNYGQQPCVYSVKKNSSSKIPQWSKCGTDICYYKNRYLKENSSTRSYYSLAFTYKCEYAGDTIYFAQCFPYSYRDLIKKIDSYEQDPFIKKICVIKEVCKSIGKLSVPVVIVKQNIRCKQNIVIMGRQHPGETPGSYMMEGLMDFLLGQSLEADALRQNMNIYIIPMVNPDGVVCGNYRCNLNGVDLNRIWNSPHRDTHESVFHIKELIRELKRTGEVRLVLDLHGHSKKFNSFFYGNPTANPLITRMLPLITSRINQGVSLIDCSFALSDNKKNTARIALQEDIGNGLSYTFETSFYGQQKHGMNSVTKFTQDSYRMFGRDTMVAFYRMQRATNAGFQVLPKQLKSCLSLEVNKELDQFISEIHLDQDLIQVGQNDSSGSEADPEEDLLVELENQSLQVNNIIKKAVELVTNKISRTKFIKTNKKITKIDKQTQTDINTFQDMLLDQSVLQIIEEQLNDLRKQSLDKLKPQKRPTSEQHTQRSVQKKTNLICEEDNPYNSPNNSWQPMQINGLQFRKSDKKGTEQSLNIEDHNKDKFDNQECQTEISLQKVLGNVQIYQIKMNQNTAFKSSYPQQVVENKNQKPLIIFLQNNRLKQQQQMPVGKLIGQKRQPPNININQTHIYIATQSIILLSIILVHMLVVRVSYKKILLVKVIYSMYIYQLDNSLSQDSKTRITPIHLLTNTSQQPALQTTKPPELVGVPRRRWNSVYQSYEKQQQKQVIQHTNENSEPVSPPSFILINEKNLNEKNRINMHHQTQIHQQIKAQFKVPYSRMNQNIRNGQEMQLNCNAYQQAAKVKQGGNFKSKMINLSFTQGRNVVVQKLDKKQK